MTDLGESDGLAAEYVLGTLSRAERAAVAERRFTDKDLDNAVFAWERLLGPLVEVVRPVAPPDDLYGKILAHIGRSRRVVSLRGGENDLRRTAGRWRNAAVTFAAMAAVLAGVIGWREYVARQTPTQYVAVLQTGTTQPAFLLTVDTQAGFFAITAVSAPQRPDKSYELWLVHDKLGAPKSLGLLAQEGQQVRPLSAAADEATLLDATFAVSLEPAGGSPSGAPTGPVLFSGKLIKATR